MELTFKKTGWMAISLLALTAGAGVSILLYNGLMAGDLPVNADSSAAKESATSLPAILKDNTWLKPIFMFMIMLAGMFFNQVFENLKIQKEAGETRTNVLRLLADGFAGITFWMAFFVSPLIFYATYYLVDKMPGGAVGYFYAFQSGFFWYNLFNRLELKSKKQLL